MQTGHLSYCQCEECEKVRAVNRGLVVTKPHDTITGAFLPTGINSTNLGRSEVCLRVDMLGAEVGVLANEDAVYVATKDLPALIAKLQEVEGRLRAEGLLK